MSPENISNKNSSHIGGEIPNFLSGQNSGWPTVATHCRRMTSLSACARVRQSDTLFRFVLCVKV